MNDDFPMVIDEMPAEWPEDGLSGDDVSEFDGEQEPREDNFRDDVEADADALASAGMGTDEDYFHDTPMADEYGGE